MTDRATLLALAEECEGATGPDRVLDGRIACELKLIPDHAPRWLREWAGPFAHIPDVSPGQIVALDAKGRQSLNWSSACLTGSLDAALTLVPARRSLPCRRAAGTGEPRGDSDDAG